MNDKNVCLIIYSGMVVNQRISQIPFNRGKISSVGRALDCRAGGRRFYSRGRTNTQALKITEKGRYCLCTASGWTFVWLG